MENREFELLARRYMDMVFRLAFSYMKSASDADDVTQNVLLRLLRRWTKGYTIKQPNMDCQPTEFTALSRHRAVFSWAGKGGIPICGA